MAASAERLMEIEGYADDGKPLTKEETDRLYEEMRSIGLRQASFTYRTEEETAAVLDGLNLEIRRGGDGRLYRPFRLRQVNSA